MLAVLLSVTAHADGSSITPEMLERIIGTTPVIACGIGDRMEDPPPALRHGRLDMLLRSTPGVTILQGVSYIGGAPLTDQVVVIDGVSQLTDGMLGPRPR